MQDWRMHAGEIVDELISEVRGRLGDRVVGAYLYGSLVTGDFIAGTSDVDLLFALTCDVDDVMFLRLAELHASFERRHPQWRNRIDASYLSCDALQRFHELGSTIVVISPGQTLTREPMTRGWAMNWYSVREDGIPCFGPAPEALIAATSGEEFLDAVCAHMRDMPARARASCDAAFRAYAVLCGCRALFTLCELRQASKREAAEWAAERHPEWRASIERALRVRGKRDESDVGVDEAVAFVEFALRELSARELD